MSCKTPKRRELATVVLVVSSDSKLKSVGLMVMKPVRKDTGAAIAATAWQHCVSVGSHSKLLT